VGQPLDVSYRLHWTMDEKALHPADSAWVKQTLRSTGDVKQSNLIRQPDGSVAYLVDFEGPSLKALPADAPVRSQVSVSDNAELVENSVRYNEHTKGWRLTLRMKIKDAGKPTEMRAALVQDVAPPAPEQDSSHVLKADKVLAKQHEKQAKKDAKDKEAKQPEAAPATPEPIKTEQVLTETWSYQLPADE
jgi:glucans biosynthesis protein